MGFFEKSTVMTYLHPQYRYHPEAAHASGGSLEPVGRTRQRDLILIKQVGLHFQDAGNSGHSGLPQGHC
jgi:hypothetical protein